MRKMKKSSVREARSSFPKDQLFYGYSSIFTLLVSLSFYRSPLVADEVFVTFQFGQDFFRNPLSVITRAIDSSIGGWETGRFISPITHLVSNSGVYLEYASHKVFNLDLITTHDIWRIFLTILIVLSALSLIFRIISIFVPETDQTLFKYISTFVLPLFLVSNDGYGGFRLGVWSYSVIFVMCLLLIKYTLDFFIKSLEGGQSRVILFFLIGAQFATIYELSQVLFFPFLFIMYASVVHQSKNQKGSFLLSYFPPNKNLIATFFGFLIPFAVIRIDSYQKCLAGCYQAASLSVESLSIEKVTNRFFSGVPWYSLTFEQNNLFASLFTFVPITICLIYLSLLWKLNRLSFAQTKNSLSSTLYLRDVIPLCIYPVLSVLFVSLGMGFSVAVQESNEYLTSPIGRSARDTVYTSIFWGFFFSLIFSYIYSRSRRFMLANRFMRIINMVLFPIVISVWITSVVAVNLNTSKNLFQSNGNFLQSRIALELQIPNFSSNGDAQRCSLIKEKLHLYPEWEGHDRSWVYGVNQIFLDEYKIPFCSVKDTELFKEYRVR